MYEYFMIVEKILREVRSINNELNSDFRIYVELHTMNYDEHMRLIVLVAYTEEDKYLYFVSIIKIYSSYTDLCHILGEFKLHYLSDKKKTICSGGDHTLPYETNVWL